MSHTFTANPSIQGMRTGQGRVEYNPAYIASLSAVEAEEAMKAEMIRILLRHPYRWPPRNAEISYVASNITLNEYYRFGSLPYRVSDFWDNQQYFKRNFEFYYREYLDLMRQLQGNGFNDQDTDGNGQHDGNGDKQENNGQNNIGGENQGTGEEDDNEGASAADGNNDTETSARNAENAALWTNDEFMDMKIRAVIEFTQQNMLSWGSIAGKLVDTILATLKPVIDYRKVLNGFRATVLSSEVTLTRFRPSRRYGFVYMGKKRRFTTRLLIGVDVSGSISDGEVNLFYSTINRFFKYGIEEIDIQQFDAELQGKPVLMKKARASILVHGRGGTDFQPIIDYFAANRNNYDGLIVFTDGYASTPQVGADNARKLLWICNNRQNYEAHQHWMSKQGRCCWITV
jgi:predicted metal-dependent peptidase